MIAEYLSCFQVTRKLFASFLGVIAKQQCNLLNFFVDLASELIPNIFTHTSIQAKKKKNLCIGARNSF